ncbi:hypothetical protein BDV23DRAFT_165972 [Aspergillus alliaceus]|uniref:Uncharacterized protein n=1 Tax=Petromyces alliaceus TaxID=209559 RepID=A0A5N7BSS6_PETAA|nr:hypothetical protein BDV23DRAFT_165972 [Aspergillus alliaceus]
MLQRVCSPNSTSPSRLIFRYPKISFSGKRIWRRSKILAAPPRILSSTAVLSSLALTTLPVMGASARKPTLISAVRNLLRTNLKIVTLGKASRTVGIDSRRYDHFSNRCPGMLNLAFTILQEPADCLVLILPPYIIFGEGNARPSTVMSCFAADISYRASILFFLWFNPTVYIPRVTIDVTFRTAGIQRT